MADDLDEFMKMKVAPRRRYYQKTESAIFVCTKCGSVQFPTTERNLRCRECSAPLIGSMESTVTVQKQIKKYNGDDETVEKLTAKIRLIRAMKKEFADTPVKVRKAEAAEQEALKPRKKGETIYVYRVVGVGRVEVPQNHMSGFVAKCNTMKATFELVGTKKEVEAMESIRRAMVDVMK